MADSEDENTGQVTNGCWRQVVHLDELQRGHISNNYSRDAENVRREYARYFSSEGSIPWQWEMVDVLQTLSEKDKSKIEDNSSEIN